MSKHRLIRSALVVAFIVVPQMLLASGEARLGSRGAPNAVDYIPEGCKTVSFEG